MSISDRTRKILWARSGNRCAKCRTMLVADATSADDAAVIGQECHIYPQGATGPRRDDAPPTDVHHYNNLILLCANCHTLVDAQHLTYSIEYLRELRSTHEAWWQSTLPTAGQAPPDRSADDEWGDDDSLAVGFESDQLFAQRLADAFPGCSGLTVIGESEPALQRLDVILRRPLHQWRPDGVGGRRMIHPLWWFRGSLSMHISNFRRLGQDHCLLDVKELRVTRIAAFRRSYYSMWDFLYVESAPDSATGLYPHLDLQALDEQGPSSSRVFRYEEYALWRERCIAREDYDDGATLVDGKPMRVSGAEVRQRYLTPYNFILCGNRHVINENHLDRTLQGILDGILHGTCSIEELASLVDGLPKPHRYLSTFD